MTLDGWQRFGLAALGVVALLAASTEARGTSAVISKLVEFLVGVVLLVVAILGVALI